MDVRCECGKILCQHETEVVIIKCRHCKRIINISLRERVKNINGPARYNVR